MRVCIQTLTFWVCKKVQKALWAMDNHDYNLENTDGSHSVYHRRNPKWYFTVSCRNDVWICETPEATRCWRNVRLGRPCEHMLLVWATLLRGKNPLLKLEDITPSFNRVYHRTSYVNISSDVYMPVPPPPTPTSIHVTDATKSEVMKTQKMLQLMEAVTQDA